MVQNGKMKRREISIVVVDKQTENPRTLGSIYFSGVHCGFLKRMSQFFILSMKWFATQHSPFLQTYVGSLMKNKESRKIPVIFAVHLIALN